MATKKQWLTRTLLTAGFLIYCSHEYFSFTGSLGFQPQRFREALSQYDVEVVRDNFGVPTVFGSDDVAVSFGLGYAQAQDRLEDIEAAIIRYRGHSARYKGAKGLASDQMIQMLGVWNRIESGFLADQLPQQTLAMLAAYADGVNAYAGIDINRSNAAVYPITQEDLIAALYIQQLYFYGFGEQLLSEIDRASGLSADYAYLQNFEALMGGNALALDGEHTAGGASYLAWNLHQPLEGAFALYEAGVNSATGWQFHGGFMPGVPLPIAGSSTAIAWGFSASKAPLVRLEELDTQHVEIYECRSDVKVFGAFTWPSVKTCYSYQDQPVLKLRDKFYALDYAGRDVFSQAEQWRQMALANNVAEWRGAFALGAITGLNFVVVDASGGIGLLETKHSGLAEGIEQYAYTDVKTLAVAVDGWTGDISLGEVSPADDIHASNNRVLRVQELVATASPIDWDGFKAIKYDHYYSKRSAEYLKVQEALALAQQDKNTEAYQLVANWDGGVDIENTAAAMALCVIEADLAPDTLAKCATRLTAQFGRFDMPWGVLSRLVKGGSYWALDGAAKTLRAVYVDSDELNEYGFRRATSGDGLHGFVSFSGGQLESAEIIAPLGQSTAKKSKHHSDQAQMFANKKLRDISFNRELLYREAAEVYRPEDAY